MNPPGANSLGLWRKFAQTQGRRSLTPRRNQPPCKTNYAARYSRADPRLSRFDPLSRILSFDDFDQGPQGWTALIGNYEGSLDSMLPEYRDLRGPMISNLTVWDTGTDGSTMGNYALKLATRPQAGSLAVALKRLTYRAKAPLRLEAFFTFKPEASELRLSETDVRAVGVLFDLQDVDKAEGDVERIMPHIRYLNALNGEQVGKWQYKSQRTSLHDIGGSGKTKSHFHLSADGWEDIPGGDQLLCYNEIATKQNWYYLRLDFDLTQWSFGWLQCNDRRFDLTRTPVMRMPAMANLWCMLNTVFFVETDCDKRAFLYLDSVLLSSDWD